MNKDEIAGKVQSTVGQAESGIGDTVGDNQASISGRVREARGAAQDALGQAKDQVGEAAARAAEFAHDIYDDPQRHIARGQQAISAQVGQSPILTIAIAGIVGMFLGYLMGRESR